jgi:hypothetical protein
VTTVDLGQTPHGYQRRIDRQSIAACPRHCRTIIVWRNKTVCRLHAGRSGPLLPRTRAQGREQPLFRMKPLKLRQFVRAVASPSDRGALPISMVTSRSRRGASVQDAAQRCGLWVIHMGAVMVARAGVFTNKQQVNKRCRAQFGSITPAPRGATDERTVSILNVPAASRRAPFSRCFILALVEQP